MGKSPRARPQLCLLQQQVHEGIRLTCEIQAEMFLLLCCPCGGRRGVLRMVFDSESIVRMLRGRRRVARRMRAAIRLCTQAHEASETNVEGSNSCLDGRQGASGWRLLHEGLESSLGRPRLP